jgi:hypothetical protein
VGLAGSWGRGGECFQTCRAWEKSGEALDSLFLDILIDILPQLKTMVTSVLFWSERLPNLNMVRSGLGIMGMSGGREDSLGV